jgi:hypothetical protein
MVVAHPPGGAPPVLHTGDARLSPEATRGQAVLQGLVGRAVLVLDTTYADPSYCFPPQQDVLDWVLRAVKVCGGAGALGQAWRMCCDENMKTEQHTRSRLPCLCALHAGQNFWLGAMPTAS